MRIRVAHGSESYAWWVLHIIPSDVMRLLPPGPHARRALAAWLIRRAVAGLSEEVAIPALKLRLRYESLRVLGNEGAVENFQNLPVERFTREQLVGVLVDFTMRGSRGSLKARFQRAFWTYWFKRAFRLATHDSVNSHSPPPEASVQ